MTYENIGQVVIDAQNYNREARSELYALVLPIIRQVVSSICKDSHEVEDIIQETFLLIFENLHQVPDPQYFIPWSKKVAANYCYRYINKHHDLPVENIEELFESLNSSYIEDPIYSVLHSENREHIDALISTLHPGLRQAVELKYYGDYKITEIAKILDVPVGTIKSRLHKAKIHLKKRICEDKYFFSFFAPILPMSLLLPKDVYQSMFADTTSITQLSSTNASTRHLTKSSNSNSILFKAGFATGSVAVISAGIISAFDLSYDSAMDKIITSNPVTESLESAPEDMVAPNIISYSLDDSFILIYVEDDGDGVDYNNSYGITDDGTLFTPLDYDEVEGILYFPKIYESFTLQVSDFNQNTSNTKIHLTQSIESNEGEDIL